MHSSDSFDTVLVVDFGAQYAQLIARRVRECHVYSEIVPYTATVDELLARKPKAIILSGGPKSVYSPGAPAVDAGLFTAGVPVLGICYGHQVMASALGGRVEPTGIAEYGATRLHVARTGVLFADLPSEQQVWMSHGDTVVEAPDGFAVTASTPSTPVAAFENPSLGLYGVQFHPEVVHTEEGMRLLQHFLRAAGCRPTWTMLNIVEEAIDTIREQIGPDGRAICGLSGGVDSAVAAAVVQRAIGDRLTCVFVDHGLLRQGEAEQVVDTFQRYMGLRLIAVNASEEFLSDLAGVTDPELKRKRIGARFVRTFEAAEAQAVAATGAAHAAYLAQGTLYPDVIESASRSEQRTAHTIKTHHNVGGLPADIQFKLIEPLRMLFKDEVRAVGEALGLPEEIVWRHPFPGPGLAIRIIGEVTWARLETLRRADAIFLSELQAAGLYRSASQAFAVLLPVRSVGVMGDGRTYADTIALRAVTTDDFMTADWAHLPYELLAKVSNRIVNEVPAVNRVVYDITSKPPATIEWE